MSLHPPREGSRDTSEGIIISKYPDVCRSPKAAIPYTIIAYQSDDANTASTVFMTGQRAHKQNSVVTRCTGDEPGVGLGVKSSTVSSVCHRKGHSSSVRIEGQWATRHGDEWCMNNRNTVGKLVWPKHNLSYDPTPPIQHSASAGNGYAEQPVEVAFANTGVMSDAAPLGGITGNNSSGTRLAFLDTSKTGTSNPTTQTDTSTTPARRAPPPPPRGSQWWKVLGGLRKLNPYLRALELFFHQNPGYFADMPVFTDAEKGIIREAQEAIDNGSDPQEVRRWAREQIEAERQRVEEETHAAPVPHARTEENISIKSLCRHITICFSPGPRVDPVEFQRQLAEQNAGLNAMTPDQYMRNRLAYLADSGGRRALAQTYQDSKRNAYRASNLSRFIQRHGPINGPIELEKHMNTLAALHSPDMTAGGAPSAVTRMGPKSVNSSLGGQWGSNSNPNSRANRLQRHVSQQIQNRCPAIMATLAVCSDIS